jgi:hypothetical protein
MLDMTIATYECKKCGSKIIVAKTGERQLSPIYCCGTEVMEVSKPRKLTKKRKKPVGKIAKQRVTKKRLTTKKKSTKR